MSIHPMQLTWRFCFVMLSGIGLVAIGASAAELFGLVEPGTLFKDGGDAQKWIALVVGVLLQPFALSAFAHARLAIDDDELRYLGFGFTCKTRTFKLADVRRWGYAVAKNQTRREPMLVFELHDGSRPQIKLAMYARQSEVLDKLTARLGERSPAKPTMTGVKFEDEL